MFSTAGRKALQSVEPAVPLSSAGVEKVHTESLSCVAPSATQKLGSVSAVRFLGDIVRLEFMLFCCYSETWYCVGCVVQCLLLAYYDVGHLSFVQNRPDCGCADKKFI